MLSSPIGRLRAIGLSEGISFLLLLGIAMPLKYMLDFPAAVKVVGWIHGVLFVLYIIALIHVTFTQRWPILKAFVGFIASLIPFGTFILDARLRREEQEAHNRNSFGKNLR